MRLQGGVYFGAYLLIGVLMVLSALFALASMGVLGDSKHLPTSAPVLPRDGQIQRWMDAQGRISERRTDGGITSDATVIQFQNEMRLVSPTGFIGLGMTQSHCPMMIHANDGREACLDWRGGAVRYSGDLPVEESARLFVEAVSRMAP